MEGSLRSLDLSFNLLRSIPEVLQYLRNLDIVYFVQNKIIKIDGLSNNGHSLRSLELGGNRIRVSPSVTKWNLCQPSQGTTPRQLKT